MATCLRTFSSEAPGQGGEVNIPKFPGRDSEPKKRLRENRTMTHIKNNDTQDKALFSRSLFLGLESLLGNNLCT